MATVDKLDIGIYVQYARRTQLIEQINQQLHFKEATSIPAQAIIVDIYPKLSEMELLLGILPLHAPWAYFFPPRTFGNQRRSTFAFHRVIPSLVSEEEEDKAEERLDAVECSTEEEENEKKTIKNCIQQVRKINSWMRHIIGRIGQFLQG